MNLLAIARCVRCDLSGFPPGTACAFKVFANLLAARTGCVEVFLRVALDFRRTAAPCRDFVSKLTQFVGQLGLIDGCGKLLRSKEALRLNGPRLAVVPLGHVENHSV